MFTQKDLVYVRSMIEAHATRPVKAEFMDVGRTFAEGTKQDHYVMSIANLYLKYQPADLLLQMPVYVINLPSKYPLYNPLGDEERFAKFENAVKRVIEILNGAMR